MFQTKNYRILKRYWVARGSATEKHFFYHLFPHNKDENEIGTFTYTTPKDNITPNLDCVLLTTITTNHNNGRLKGQSTV